MSRGVRSQECAQRSQVPFDLSADDQLKPEAIEILTAQKGVAIGAAQASAGAGSGAQNEPGVVDAEFEEVDKRDRKAG
jgi:hypothetical protein